MNEPTPRIWRIWNIYRFLKYLFILVSTSGVAYLVFAIVSYRGKAVDNAIWIFTFFLIIVVVPTNIAYVIAEKVYKHTNSRNS